MTANPTPDPIHDICRFARETRFDDLPSDIVQTVTWALLDAIAVGIGGSAMDGIKPIVDLVRERGGAGQSALPIYGGRYPANEVALALAPMMRAMDCGDLHEDAGHVGEYIVPGLIAAIGLVDGPVSGEEFLVALAVGLESLIRIGSAYHVISRAIPHHDCGGHYVFGAVAAVGRLIGLTASEMAHAQGIARTMTQPHTMAIYSPATLMIRAHHGLVCQSAITACELARKGITGPTESVLTGPSGLLETVAWKTDSDLIAQDLGEVWRLRELIFKGLSGCYFNHSPADAIIAQLDAHGFSFDDIVRVHVEVSPSAWVAVCEPLQNKWNPQTVAECQFSLPYAVATAAYDRELFVEAYGDDRRRRRAPRELMTRITASRSDDVGEWGSRVTTDLNDGRQFSSHQLVVAGHPSNPFGERDFIAKFHRCVRLGATEMSSKTIQLVIDRILAVGASTDVEASIIAPLMPV